MPKPERGENRSKRTCALLSTPRFARYLRQAPWGGLKIDMAAVHREAKLDGKWVITSNDDTLSAEDLALGHKQLMRVEQWPSILCGTVGDCGLGSQLSALHRADQAARPGPGRTRTAV